MIFRNMTIGQRLAIGFGVVIALLAMLATISYGRISSLNTEVDSMVNERYPKTVAVNGIKNDVNELTRSMLNVLIMTDPDQIKAELANIAARNAGAERALGELTRHTGDAEGKQILAAIAVIRNRFGPATDAFVKLISEDKKDEALVKFLFSLRPQQSKYFMQLDAFVAHQHGAMVRGGNEASSSTRTTQWLILVLTLVAGAISLAVAYLLTRSITAPLNEAVGVAKRVAGGDLTGAIAVRRNDETGQMMAALREMNAGLIRIVAEVRSGTDSIAAASTEIASGNLDLSSRTEEQAAALGQTSGAMRELTDTVQQNADNARQANKLAAQASEVAMRGGAVVTHVITTMGSITASSKKIVDIIGVIDGIAFQTNILALNAAVEAARAGEQGRGFAVVASEVRNLAQRSAAAAKEIKALIGDSVHKVNEGSDLVAQAGVTMAEVVASVRRVTDIMADITAASQEQSSGIAQVNLTIHQMDESTQQNAALVEEAAAAAASMQDQAANLARVVSIFKLDGGHGHARARVDLSTGKGRRALTGNRKPSTAALPKAFSRQQAAGGDWEEF